MPHVQEALKEDIHDARKGLANDNDLQNKVDPDHALEPEPTLFEKVTEPLKNLFRSRDSSEKEVDHHSTKKKVECHETYNVKDELKKSGIPTLSL